MRAHSEEQDAHGPGPGPRVPGLSIVLPAFNEEANVEAMIESCLEVLPELADRYEVIVVDDGSADATSEVVAGWVERRYPEVRLLAHDVNRGYGAAIRSGLQQARYDLVFYTDADRQFDVSELNYFLPLMQDHDMVIGFRVYRYDSVLRSIVSWAYNQLVKVLFRVRVRDVDCAFKLLQPRSATSSPSRPATSSSTPRSSPAPAGGTSASPRRASATTRGWRVRRRSSRATSCGR